MFPWFSIRCLAKCQLNEATITNPYASIRSNENVMIVIIQYNIVQYTAGIQCYTILQSRVSERNILLLFLVLMFIRLSFLLLRLIRGVAPPLRGVTPRLRGVTPRLRGVTPRLWGVTPRLWCVHHVALWSRSFKHHHTIWIFRQSRPWPINITMSEPQAAINNIDWCRSEQLCANECLLKISIFMKSTYKHMHQKTQICEEMNEECKNR